MIEHAFTCPWCWETITMLLDPSAGAQRYIEDCEVCCRPIDISYRIVHGEVEEFDAQPSNQ